MRRNPTSWPSDLQEGCQLPLDNSGEWLLSAFGSGLPLTLRTAYNVRSLQRKGGASARLWVEEHFHPDDLKAFVPLKSKGVVSGNQKLIKASIGPVSFED